MHLINKAQTVTMSNTKLEIVNLVSLWKTSKQIEIDTRNQIYKKKYNAQVIKEKGNCLLVFASGKVIATGFKTVTTVAEMFSRYFKQVKLEFVRNINLTVKTKLPFKVNNHKLLSENNCFEYEPEIYPAIYWRSAGICLMYYASSSVVMTGNVSIAKMDETYNCFVSIVEKYQKN